MKKSLRIVPLDALRGLAAFAIAFLWHYRHLGIETKDQPFYNVFHFFYENGTILVELFFIISGFVFAYIYQDHQINDRTLFSKTFWVNRFSRLYPLHILTFVVVVCLIWVNQGDYVYHDTDFKHFIYNIFFLQSGFFDDSFNFNGPAWSISCEILMYFLFLITLLFFRKKRIYTYFFYIILGLIIRKFHLNYFIFNHLISRALIHFFLGCLLFEFYENKFSNHSFLQIFIGLSFIFILCLKIPSDHWKMSYTMILFPFIIYATLKLNWIHNFLTNPFSTYLGNISFSIYLWHHPVQFVLRIIKNVYNIQFDYSSSFFLIFYMILTIVIASISFYQFEKPFTTFLRSRFIK